MANELRTALPTYEERRAAGRALRDKVKRGDWAAGGLQRTGSTRSILLRRRTRDAWNA